VTQNNSETSRSWPKGTLLQVLIAHGDEGMQFSTKWFADLDEQQKYEVADLVERVSRYLSPTLAENMAKHDEAAALGSQIIAAPALHEMILPLLELRAWKDADDDDSAPQD
jgi:hypothetical protein